MNLSKSKYCKCVQCKKMLWLETFKKEVAAPIDNETVLDNGTSVGELARNLFKDHITIPFDLDLSKMITATEKALNNESINICEASFSYNSNFCSVDILSKKGSTYEIYEVKSSTEVSDIYIDDAGYQYYVLTKLGYNVEKVYIVHINNKYVRHGELELDKLFTKEDVTVLVHERLEEIDKNIKEINEYMKNTSEPAEDLDTKCFKPYPCPFFKYCSRFLPDNNVFSLASMKISDKIKLYKSNIISYEDLLKSNILYKYKEQIEFELYNKPDYIDEEKIKELLKTYTYPLYFLDFESFQEPIPMYDNVRPYMQIPFQYSLHYQESENSPLMHKEFLSVPGIDPRRSLAESLVSDIPKDTCVLAYNMSFEKTRIKELAEIYPDLREHLLNIYSNIKDLMIPFQNRWYYSKDMHGSYSIKCVLPALYPNDPELDYHLLPVVHNGKEASATFLDMKNMSPDEQSSVREGLLKYCKLDTLAMVKIYKKLKK